jgi:hypothetical protein
MPQYNQSTFSLVPAGQLGVAESQLPPQPIIGSGNASATGSSADVSKLNGTVVNGGNATANEGWSQTLQREFANRFMAAVFCGWWVFYGPCPCGLGLFKSLLRHATGGSIPNLLPRLPDNQLNVTLSINNTGNVSSIFIYCCELWSEKNVDVWEILQCRYWLCWTWRRVYCPGWLRLDQRCDFVGRKYLRQHSYYPSMP